VSRICGSSVPIGFNARVPESNCLLLVRIALIQIDLAGPWIDRYLRLSSRRNATTVAQATTTLQPPSPPRPRSETCQLFLKSAQKPLRLGSFRIQTPGQRALLSASAVSDAQPSARRSA